MRRLLPFLLLLAAPAMCWAAPAESEPAAKNGACVYARPATPPAARSTPKPAATGGGGGGGGDGDSAVPRVRGNRWHSFLPGMFR